MLRPLSDICSDWLNSTPPLSMGARSYLSARLRKRAIPFIPICAFGFALDEAGPATNEWRPGSCGAGALPSPGDED
jgi:hypothetical protein